LEGFAPLPPEPFPVVTSLRPNSNDESPPVLSGSFLGVLAPRLRSLYFDGIPFLGLRKLLLSAHDLVTLHLWDIPHSGYISPEAMVTCLSTLTTFRLGFRSPRSYPNRVVRRRPPPLSILPALISLTFRGVSEYLEDLVFRIDAPVLNMIEILFFNQLTFNITQLPQFIDRLGKFKAFNQADIVFSENSNMITLTEPAPTVVQTRRLTLAISCRQSDWQLSSLAQICSSSFPSLSTLECLNIYEQPHSRPHWQDDMENTQWTDLLQPFTAVKELYLSDSIAQRVAPALKELPMERATGVMPVLRNVFLVMMEFVPSWPTEEAIEQSVIARQLFGCPVTVYSRRGRGWVHHPSPASRSPSISTYSFP